MTASIDLDVQLPVEPVATQSPVEPIAGDAVESFGQAMEQPKPDAGMGLSAFGEAVKAFAETAFVAEEQPRAAEEQPKALGTVAADEADAGDAADRMVASGMTPQASAVSACPEAPEGPVAAGTVAADAVEAVGRVAKIASPAEVMLQVAEEVADAIIVSPGLLRGEGEIRIQLKPDVLDGSEVRISVEGRRMGVELLPVAADTAAFIERNLPQLQQLLTARVHAFTIGVSMRRNRVGRA